MKIIDLHCDTLYKHLELDTNYSLSCNDGHISEEGLRAGGYMAQCFAIYQPARILGEDGYSFFIEQCDYFRKFSKECSLIRCAVTGKDIENNYNQGKISAVITVENADFLNNRIERLKEARDRGIRILGLIHNGENCLGFPQSRDKRLDCLPLKDFGKEVIDAINYTDLIADVSHLNYGGFRDVAELSKKPFIATHSGCREVFDHPRNLYDEQIKSIAQSGGVVGVLFYSCFLNGTDSTAAEDVIRHIEHLINVGGEDVAAIGTDFDGMDCEMFISGAGGMQKLAEMLIKKFGYSIAEKICFRNAIRNL